MIIEKRQINGHTLLRVEGVIKLGESAEFFADALKRVLAEKGGHVLVDLSKINYMDSTGIGELVGYLSRFRKAKRKLILIQPSAQVRKLLRIAHLDELLPVCDRLEDALESDDLNDRDGTDEGNLDSEDTAGQKRVPPEAG